MQTIEQALEKLKKSDFRARFHLSDTDVAYIKEKGMKTIRKHGEDFIAQRQTPMRGHPVFKAQHACGCCCRGCLEKWYRVPQGIELTENQQKRIVNLLMAWIEKELKSRSK